MNAHYIVEGMPQSERVVKLNQLAIHQMKILVQNEYDHPLTLEH